MEIKRFPMECVPCEMIGIFQEYPKDGNEKWKPEGNIQIVGTIS